MAYAQPVEPVDDVADWEVPDEIQEMQVYPPVEAPPSGRRKELRIPSAGEDDNRRTVRYERCHELGITVSDVRISLHRLEVSCIVILTL